MLTAAPLRESLHPNSRGLTLSSLAAKFMQFIYSIKGKHFNCHLVALFCNCSLGIMSLNKVADKLYEF